MLHLRRDGGVLLLFGAICFAVALVYGRDPKLEYMLDRAKQARSHVVRLVLDDFKEYVTRTPRSYSIILVLNAKSARFGCKACQELGRDYPLLATTYFDHQFGKGISIPKNPVFFVEIDYEDQDGSNIFEKLKQSNAPTVVHLGPSSQVKRPGLSTFLAKIDRQNRYDFNRRGFTAEDMSKWVSQSVGIDEPDIVRPFDWSSLIIEKVLPLLVLGAAAYFLGPRLYFLVKQPYVYFALGMIAYLFAISGGMFNILQNVPFHGRDRNGNPEYFAGSGYQYAAEGYFMGSIQVTMGFTLILMNSIAMTHQKKATRLFVGGGSLVVLFFLFSRLRSLVSSKMGDSYNDGYVYSYL